MSHIMSSSSSSKKQMCENENCSWSNLPQELLLIIAERLHLRSDILNFRSVHRLWRDSAPPDLLDGKINILSPILPHNFSIDPSAPYLFTRNPLRLVATSVFLIRSLVNPHLQPWLCSVEEVNPGKLRLFKSLSRDTEKQVSLRHLSLPCFRVSQISSVCTLSYVPHDGHTFRIWKKRSHSVFEKAVLYLESDNNNNNNKCESDITADDYALMVLYSDRSNEGSLAKISLKDGGFSQMTCHGVKRFDDVVCFKKRVCVIDRKGRLYWEENGNLKLITKELVGAGEGADGKKRLVVELSSDELYLVYRFPFIGVPFKVYKLNEGEHKWEELKGIGDHRVIVATHNGCFFVQTKDLPTWGGNCLVFSRGVFPAYISARRPDSEIFEASKRNTQDVAIFDFGTGKCKPMGKDLAEVLWPPPAWLSSDTQFSICCHKDGEVATDSPEQNCPELSGIKEISFMPLFNDDTQAILAKECLSVAEIQEKQSRAGSSPETSCDNNAQTNGISEFLQSLECGVTKTKFQGVDVSSHLVPTLNEIWAKHGNILEGHPVKSNDLVAWALESMAKVVILLRNTSGRSLSHSEAEYLYSTLSDLQLMRMNVNWLFPP